MNEKVIVLDNFYKNPDAVRRFALSLDYEDQSTPNYPGHQSVIPCLSKSIVARLEHEVGAKIDVEQSRGQMGYFRFIFASGKSRLKVHTDMLDWTVVIYLSPNCPPEVGTNLYRHKHTGLIGPPKPDELTELGYQSFEDFEQKVVVADTLNDNAWEITRRIEYRYNRCLLFKANELFHAHSKGYGDRFDNGRLTQNFFFNELAA